MAGLNLNESYSVFACARTSFDVVTLLVLTVSYIIVILNVQRNLHSQNVIAFQAAGTLSVTLSIVTGVSDLTNLPRAIYKSLLQHLKEQQTYMSSNDIHNTLAAISFVTSIVNPLNVYAIRMQ